MQHLPASYNELLDRLSLKSEVEQNLKIRLRQFKHPSEMPMLEQSEWLRQMDETDYFWKTTQIATWFQIEEVRKGYWKHMAFFKAGAKFDERALFGGNRTGKTHCGVYEDVLHLTGLYPDWWEGWRWYRPVDMWAATDTAKNTRDILQEKFCGKPGVPDALGTGMIPRELLAREPTLKHGTPSAFETVYVYHHTDGVMDGISTLMLKSYDQGRESFQGTKQDLIHLDEEPKIEIYSESSLRLMSTVPGEQNGKLILTETPLLGITELMTSFMPELRPEPMTEQEWDHPEDEEPEIVINE